MNSMLAQVSHTVQKCNLQYYRFDFVVEVIVRRLLLRFNVCQQPLHASYTCLNHAADWHMSVHMRGSL
jgi:hypothetical protein